MRSNQVGPPEGRQAHGAPSSAGLRARSGACAPTCVPSTRSDQPDRPDQGRWDVTAPDRSVGLREGDGPHKRAHVVLRATPGHSLSTAGPDHLSIRPGAVGADHCSRRRRSFHYGAGRMGHWRTFCVEDDSELDHPHARRATTRPGWSTTACSILDRSPWSVPPTSPTSSRGNRCTRWDGLRPEPPWAMGSGAAMSGTRPESPVWIGSGARRMTRGTGRHGVAGDDHGPDVVRSGNTSRSLTSTRLLPTGGETILPARGR